VNLHSFFTELKRRNVYKIAIAYGVVAWLLLQAASILFPTFEAPPWTMKVFVTVAALGFPVALIIAWAFELTPEGLKRTEVADELPRKSERNRTWIYVVIIAGAVAASFFFLGRYTSSKQATEMSEKSIATVQTHQVGSEISRSGATHWPFPVTTENAHLLLADPLRNGSVAIRSLVVKKIPGEILSEF